MAIRLKCLKDTAIALLISAFIVAFVCTFLVVGWHFSDIQNKTKGLTNYGFAIFAALASITFSWYRAIDKNIDGYDGKTKKLILGCAECSFAGAILFLISSISKYTSTYFSSLHSVSDTIISNILKVVFVLLFPFAFGLAALAIASILIIMILRVNFYRSVYFSVKK